MSDAPELSLGGAYIAIFVVGFFGSVLPAAFGGWGFLAWLVLVSLAGFVGANGAAVFALANEDLEDIRK